METGPGMAGMNMPTIDVIGLMKGPKKPRNRAWEKEHRAKTFRGVPEEVSDKVVAIADQLGVTADEVARAFMEYGLYCMERETLTVQPKIKGARMTLYPLDSGWTQQHGWVEDGWNPAPKAIAQVETRRKKKEQKEPPLWAYRASYRLPGDLIQKIKEKAESHHIPVGELVTLLLKHSTSRYEAGVLRLIPYPKQEARAEWSES
ncbi:hypothetical protein [Bellilinea sp.]|uniref:hypothetical protein n=1 Tax=Bellilinea sp. TaxID=2838785 RepID=UPI002ADD4DD1|nr:hypothetical protein [Bellilinea sp.]